MPDVYERHLENREFSYVSVNVPSGEFGKFVVWLAKPIAQVNARAEKFIHRLYGKVFDYHVYPRTYVRDARAFARLGMHEDAPTPATERTLRRYRDMWQSTQRRTDECHMQLASSPAMQGTRPPIVETGTYLGQLTGASLRVWRDRFGDTHAAPAWMHSLKTGQKFEDGIVIPLLEPAELAPIVADAAPSIESELARKRAAGDARVVAGAEGGPSLWMVLSWQGEWDVVRHGCVHQDSSPLLEVVAHESDGPRRVIGSCMASLFASPLTPRSALESVLHSWRVSAALDDVREWLKLRMDTGSRPSLKRNWPLSRMAVRTQAELAAFGDR